MNRYVVFFSMAFLFSYACVTENKPLAIVGGIVMLGLSLYQMYTLP